MSGWNYADVWETIADTTPEALAQVAGARRQSWRDLDQGADGVAQTLLAAGLSHQDKVALYLYNGMEYVETVFGALKAGFVPVNTNYRYVERELHYLWDNADVAAVVFHGTFTDRAEALRAEMPQVRIWIHVDDGTAACPSWAVPYEQARRSAQERCRAPWSRSGDDLILIYTGGTTGRPKGVMWRQHDLYRASDTNRDPAEADLDHVRSRVSGSSRRLLGVPAAPLMHGTAFVYATTLLNAGGSLALLTSRQFDPRELLDLIDEHGAQSTCIVGDAFCRPLVEALDAEPDRWTLDSLRAVASSGAMWSPALKERLVGYAPKAQLIDFLNSSEASGMGKLITGHASQGEAARFRLGPNAFLIDEAGQVVTQPGGVGMMAVKGNLPLGYYKDPDGTSTTFRTVEGERCSVPGDHARLEEDGSITLLGRGSSSINTGGEKVYPEEVEQVLKEHPRVRDAVVVGLAHERFGESVAAAVEAVGDLDVDELRSFARERLAAYKVPRAVMTVPSIQRGPNGKADHRTIKEQVSAWARSGQAELS